MTMGQNLVPLVNIKITGKWMFIPIKWHSYVLTHLKKVEAMDIRWSTLIKHLYSYLKNPSVWTHRLRKNTLRL